MASSLYLIPIVLHEDEQALKTIPHYIHEALQECSVFYVENERTARRFLKKINKAIDINKYEWHTIDKASTEVLHFF